MIFIGAAVEELIGIKGPLVSAVFYAVFIGIHLTGVGRALKILMAISLLALCAIVATAVALIGSFDAANLFNITPTDALGASSFLPFGWYRVWAALPFGMWFFLAVEGVPLAAEEAKNPARDVPRGIIGAMLVLLCTATLVVILLAGAAVAEMIGRSGVPVAHCIDRGLCL